jgi:thioredoxin-like negative regulator of GroEL
MRVIKFGAEWCSPCKALDAELEKCTEDFELVRCDVEEDIGAVRLNGIQSLPTLLFIRDGQEVARLTGRQSARKIDSTIQKVS